MLTSNEAGIVAINLKRGHKANMNGGERELELLEYPEDPDNHEFLLINTDLLHNSRDRTCTTENQPTLAGQGGTTPLTSMCFLFQGLVLYLGGSLSPFHNPGSLGRERLSRLHAVLCGSRRHWDLIPLTVLSTENRLTASWNTAG